MTSLIEFITEYYQSCKLLPKYYPSVETYIPSFIEQGNITMWLDSLRDQDLSMSTVDEISSFYVNHFQRERHEIPQILVSIMRTRNIEIPVVEGILTSEFWAVRELPPAVN